MNDKAVATLPKWKEAIVGAQERFVAIAERDKLLDWARESMFALQALEKSDYLRKVAEQNPGSLRNAIVNVAAIGLTLNPASQYAALVPRKGAICLDVMYRGFIRLATDSGSVKWAQAELVYEGDDFLYKGKAEAPLHEVENPFRSDRKIVLGAYTIARTADGADLTEIMSAEEINRIRDRSEGWQAFKNGKASQSPWDSDWGEMAKKTVIKRARKTWPESKDSRSAERLQTAVDLSNEADGFAALEHAPEPSGKILPTDGAWDSLNEEAKQLVHKTAEAMKKRLVAYDIPGAVAAMEGGGLDSEGQVALWTLFDSRARTAMTKFMREAKPSAIEHTELDRQAVAAMERDAA